MRIAYWEKRLELYLSTNLPRTRPLVRGVLSFISPSVGVHNVDNELGTVSSASCYSTFLRLVHFLGVAGIQTVPKVVAEFGPGSSLGTGFAALIAGAEKYYALDLINSSNTERNLQVFDELVALFRRKAPIPSTGLQSRRFPDLDCYDYPELLEPDLAYTRIEAIRRDIAAKTGIFVEVAAPWMHKSIVKPKSVDWIFSNSVLEHVNDVATVYRVLAQWLKPFGYVSHMIDFDSHGTMRQWNGHWAVSDFAWRALQGRLPYLLNRLPYSEHVRLAAEAGFSVVLEKRNKNFDGLIPEQFQPRFRTITDEDARMRMVFQISRLSR